MEICSNVNCNLHGHLLELHGGRVGQAEHDHVDAVGVADEVVVGEVVPLAPVVLSLHHCAMPAGAAHPENSQTLQSPTAPRLSCCTLMARVPWSWLGPGPATAATSPGTVQ